MTMLQVYPEYGYVVVVAVASVFVVMWMGINVGRARKRYDVKYPTMYHETNIMFNCIQRAHQNMLENYSTFLMLLLLGGLQYPRLCALAGVIYLLGRIVYAMGYYSGIPEKRNQGAFGYLGLFTLLGSCISLAFNLIGNIASD